MNPLAVPVVDEVRGGVISWSKREMFRKVEFNENENLPPTF